MKTLMLIIALMTSSEAIAQCLEPSGMADNFYRCENAEAICYQAYFRGKMSISCLPKPKSK